MIYLALIAVVEAVVYQRRYRSATHGGPIEAAWWALCTCVLRFAAPLLGVSEFFRGGDPVLLTAVYAVPAAIATGLVRWWENRRTRTIAFTSESCGFVHAAEADRTAVIRSHGIPWPNAAFEKFVTDQERADAEKHSASRIGPTNTERGT